MVPDAVGEECSPAQIYGPAPACVDDARCVEEHGAGWYCERGTYDVPDGCGGVIHWPTGACKPGPGTATDAGAPEGGVAADAAEDVLADRSPADMAQLVRDAAARTEARDGASRAVPDYGVPEPEPVAAYGLPMAATPQGRVTAAGLPQQVGGTGTIDVEVVQRKLYGARARAKACYETALRDDPALAGTLQLEVGVSASGRVTASVVTDDPGLQAAGVTDCVLQQIRRESFAASPPQGGDIQVRFGLRFAPMD
jgi:hypothetical protein